MTSETFDLRLTDHAVCVQRIEVDAPARSPTLVFLHDSLGCIATWRDFPAVLAERLRLNAIVFDRRGYGGSSPFPPSPRTPRYLEAEGESLVAVLAALEISSAVLIGPSDGGSIALIAAALAPQRIRAVVTEGAHVFVEEITLAGIRDARETLRTTNLHDKLTRHHGDKTARVTSAWIDTWLSRSSGTGTSKGFCRASRVPCSPFRGSATNTEAKHRSGRSWTVFVVPPSR